MNLFLSHLAFPRVFVYYSKYYSTWPYTWTTSWEEFVDTHVPFLIPMYSFYPLYMETIVSWTNAILQGLASFLRASPRISLRISLSTFLRWTWTMTISLLLQIRIGWLTFLRWTKMVPLVLLITWIGIRSIMIPLILFIGIRWILYFIILN